MKNHVLKIVIFHGKTTVNDDTWQRQSYVKFSNSRQSYDNDNNIGNHYLSTNSSSSDSSLDTESGDSDGEHA